TKTINHPCDRNPRQRHQRQVRPTGVGAVRKIQHLLFADLIVFAEILYRFSPTPDVYLHQQSINLFEAFLESGFAVSRFPGLQIRHSDEVFLADLHYWNVIFLNDSAEMAWRIARLESRTRNIEKVRLRLTLNCLWVHFGSSVPAFLQAKFQFVKNRSRSLPCIRSFEKPRS